MKEKIHKVLIVIPSLKIGGGAEKVAYSLFDYFLKDRNISPYIMSFYKDNNDYIEEQSNICLSLNENINDNLLIKIYKLFKRAYLISKNIKLNKIQTTISFMEDANFSLILSKLLFQVKAKIIISIRTNPEIAYKKNYIYRALIKILYKFADEIICNSRYVEKYMRDTYKLNNISTIYNPIDLKDIQKKSEQKIDSIYNNIFHGNDFIFINVGRLEKPKNHKFLIEVFHKVHSCNINTKLVILGEGSKRTELERLISNLGLQGSVFLLGNQKNIYPFLKKSDCFVFTSLWEGMPNVLIEAISMNLPIIAMDSPGGVRELLFPNLEIDTKIIYPYSNNNNSLFTPDSYCTDMLMKQMLSYTKGRKQSLVQFKKNITLNMFKIGYVIDNWRGLL